MKLHKNDRSALIGTIAFHGVLLIIVLLLGLTYQVPPPEEQGVEVALGYTDQGMGNIPTTDPSELPASVPTSRPDPTDVVTQSHQETYTMNQDRRQTDRTRHTEQVDQTPAIDESLLYTGRRQQGSGQGETAQPGSQGHQDGDVTSGHFSGSPGGGGISYNLGGRGAKAIPKPNYDSDDQGKVVVTIWVDRDGRVTNAQAGARGSTTSSLELRKLAEDAAKRAAFMPNPSGPEVQVGTITYTFIRLN